MKIYIDLLDDEFREIFPATMFDFRRELENELVPKMVDMPHHAGLIAAAYSQLAIDETIQLSQKIAEFTYSDEDNKDGFLQATMGRFTLELKVDEALDRIAKRFDEDNLITSTIRYGGNDIKPLKETWETFDKAAFKTFYMSKVRSALRRLESQVWEHITSRLREILIVVEQKPLEPSTLTITKF